MRRTAVIWGIIVLVCVIVAAALLLRPNVSASSGVTEVRWLLSHQPTDAFVHATEVFAKTLQDESGGTLTLKIIRPQDIGVTKGDVPYSQVKQLLDARSTDVASVYTVALGKDFPNFQILNLPFLFSSYDQANASLDGSAVPILGTVTGDERALALTMSGGFRIIASKNTDIHSPTDLKGKRVATSGGPVAEATLSALGAIPVPMDLESGSAKDLSSVDGVETTYARLAPIVASNSAFTAHINETDHSLFLTAIVVSRAFYDSLTPQQRIALDDAARTAAKTERADSIALNAKVKQELQDSGSTVNVLTHEQQSAFKTATDKVYAQFAPQFDTNIYHGVTGR